MRRIIYQGVVRGALALAAVLSFGCGSSEEVAASGAEEPGTGEVSSAGGNPPADRSSQPAAEPERCPPRLSTPKPDADAPVADILDVRPGQTFDDVYALLGCRDEGYSLEVAEHWLVRETGDLSTRQVVRASDGVPCTGQEIARDMGNMAGSRCIGGFTGSNFRAVRDTTDEIHVAFTGLFGEEVAGAVWRARSYEEDARPSIENLEQAMTAKYGPPSYRQEMRNSNWGLHKGDIEMSWVYDLRGRKLSAENPMHQQCLTIGPLFAYTHRWSAGCGITLHAGIRRNRGNDLLADALHIGVMDQKAFYEASEQFKADVAAAIEQQRQEAASKAATVSTEL